MFIQYIPSCLAKELAMVIQDFLRTGCVVPYPSARKWFIFNNWFALTFNAFAVRGCCVVGPYLDVSTGSSCIGYI